MNCSNCGEPAIEQDHCSICLAQMQRVRRTGELLRAFDQERVGRIRNRLLAERASKGISDAVRLGVAGAITLALFPLSRGSWRVMKPSLGRVGSGYSRKEILSADDHRYLSAYEGIEGPYEEASKVLRNRHADWERQQREAALRESQRRTAENSRFQAEANERAALDAAQRLLDERG